jgi:hypothetical protein
MDQNVHTGAGIHEFTHIFTYDTIITPGSYYDDTSHGLMWIFEGLANFMQNFNTGLMKENNLPNITCFADGYQYQGKDKKSYADLGSGNTSYSDSFYTTGACFWKYIYDTFGEAKFKSLLQYIASTRHDVGVYKLFDEFEKILGKDISDIASERFHLDKNMTVKIFF